MATRFLLVLGVLVLGPTCLVLAPVSAQQTDQRSGTSTATWGTMPNGWVNHGTTLSPRPSPLAPHSPLAPNRGTGFDHRHGRFPASYYPRYYYPGYSLYGYGPAVNYGVGYRCSRCLSPYCFDPYCRGAFFNGTVVSGLSLSIVAPQIVAPARGAQLPGGQGPIDAANGGLGAAGASGLPWLDRLRRQQADVFDQQRAAFDAERNAEFLRKNEAAKPQIELDAKLAQLAGADADPAAEIRRRVADLKLSNQAGRDRSDQLIAEADRFFSQQQLPKAAQRYRQAIAAAPNYPKALFRAAHYFVAAGDYQNSLDAYLMALEISRDVRQPGFQLDDLYRGNMLDKLEHVNRLAEAALNAPEDGGLLMLVGLTLFYDQQPDRARTFFRSAAELGGPHVAYVGWFLRSLEP